MAAKKTVKTTRKAKNARVKGIRPRENSPAQDKQRWIEGLIMILIGIYCYYAFVTAQPTLIDRLIGKYILMYLFGNGVPVLCILLIVSGILLMLNKLRDYKKTISYLILIAGNFMVFLSAYIPNLTTNYKIINLFDLAAFGGAGGIVGTLIAYLLNSFLTRTGTTLVLIALTIIEIALIIKSNFPNIYSEAKKKEFGLTSVRDKYYDIKEDINQKKLVKEEKKNQELQDFNFIEFDMKADDDSEIDVRDAITNEIDIEEVDDLDFDTQDLGEKKKLINENLLDQYMFPNFINSDQSEPEPKKDKDDFFANLEYEPISEVEYIEDDEEELEEIDESEEIDLILIKNSQKEVDSSDYQLPSVELLNKVSNKSRINEKEIKHNASKIKETLNDFKIDAAIRNFEKGPSITRYEVKPAPGVKVSKIVNLADDLALALATSDIRIEAPIPGRDAIGIEVPNKKSDIVHIREIIDSNDFNSTKSELPFAVGKTLSGHNIIGDISTMPHLLIAGSTGSGKSVCINSILISLLYHEKPEDLKLILIDPKMVELSQYNSIPHLLVPVVTEPQKAEGALNWAIREMEDRYKLFKETGVRDLETYNELMLDNNGEKLPRIVIVIDELADLMMTSPKEVESAICRIAQKARACGIHLIIATQRPSVDVITGLIKSNIPSRIAFAVASNTDSRTILDTAGAEKLLGKGDMLYKPVGLSKPLRIQCCYVSDKEITNVIKSVQLEKQPEFDDQISESIERHVKEKEIKQNKKTRDKLYDQAIEVAFMNKQLSTSMLQRKLGIGYARAGRIIDTLELDGIISGPNGSKPRKLLISENEYRGI